MSKIWSSSNWVDTGAEISARKVVVGDYFRGSGEQFEGTWWEAKPHLPVTYTNHSYDWEWRLCSPPDLFLLWAQETRKEAKECQTQSV